MSSSIESSQINCLELEQISNQEESQISDTNFCSIMPQTTSFPHCYYNNSLAIRQEIQRFESVHPSIYAIYDLLELIGGADGQLIAQRMREHVVCIEGNIFFD